MKVEVPRLEVAYVLYLVRVLVRFICFVSPFAKAALEYWIVVTVNVITPVRFLVHKCMSVSGSS